MYGFAKTRGIKVKGNGSGANCRDVEVDCHYLEEDGGTSRRLEVNAGEEFLLVEVAQLFVGLAAGKRKCQRLESEGRRRVFRRNLFISRLG